MRHLFSFMLKMLLDQRGEVGESEDVAEVADDSQETDDENVIEINPELLEEDEDEDDDEGNQDDQEKTKKEESKRDEDLKAELAKRDEQIKEMNRNFYGLRKKFDKLNKKKTEETGLTDEELEDLIEANQDDPKAMLKIMKQVSQQAASSNANNAVKTVEISQRRKELDEHLLSTWPDARTEGSETHTDIENAKEFFYVTDHPLGDFLGAAGRLYVKLPEMLENARKEGRENALKTKAEENRKTTIKANSLDTGAKKTSAKVSGKHLAAAKQLGLTESATKIMAQIVNQNKKNASVEV